MAGINYAEPFVNGVKITTTQAVLFTAPPDVFSVVFGASRLVHFNEAAPAGTGVVTTIDLWLVQPGDDETNAKFKIVSQKSMAVSETYVLNELIMSALLAGGEVWGQASVNDMVSFTASGSERLS
jgi:hypothetical protein